MLRPVSLGGVLLLAVTAALAAPVPVLEFEAPAELAAVAARLERIEPYRLEAAMRLAGMITPGPPVRVVLAPEGSPAADAAPPWVSGYAYGALGRVVLLPERTPRYPDSSLEELLVHEVSHVLVARASAGRPVPRWFNEGLAMLAGSSWNLEDRARLTLVLLRRAELPLAEVERMFAGGPLEVTRAYAVAGALMRYLVQRYGRRAPARILDGLAAGLEFDEAFFRATGSELERALEAFWRRHSFWYRWFPILSSSATLWLVVLAVAAAAYQRKRRRAAALEEAWELEETHLPPPDAPQPPPN